MAEIDELVIEFLAESRHNLDQLDCQLARLGPGQPDAESLAAIFRTVHTLKGTSGLLAFHRIEALTHAAENLLSGLRDTGLRSNLQITSALLAVVDAVRALLANIETAGDEGKCDFFELIDRLNRLQRHGNAEAAAEADSAAIAPLGQFLIRQAGVAPSAITAARELQRQGDARTIGEILVAQGAVSAAAASAALEAQREARSANPGEPSIRIDAAWLAKLARLVDELERVRDQITKLASGGLIESAQRLDRIAADLRAHASKATLQPIQHVWDGIARLLQDLAAREGKRIRVEIEGGDVQLDRALMEAVKHPLTHIVRNCVDHGIESPAQRLAIGKPAEGCIRLRAFPSPDRVTIEITDDGAGMALDRIRQKAITMRFIDSDQAAHLSERDTANLAFFPGLTTAETITNVSGRGVGMDVVKTNVEKAGGSVELHTQAGKGTTVRIKLPIPSGFRSAPTNAAT